MEASVCEFCDIAADFVADSFETIFLEATALAEVELEGFADGGFVEASADVLAEKIVEASATAFAQVIIRVLTVFAAGAPHACILWIIILGLHLRIMS